jgi:tRNA threonylcarbamoyladenosine modification (KEOPS) complex Cgi121 subunit
MVPFNKNFNFYIDDNKIQSHLFNETVNTDNLSDSIKVEYNLDDIKNDIISVESDEFINGLSEFLGVDLSRFMKEEDCEDVPTLDEILDKINENGVESLTVIEKILLDEYSKG